MESYLETLLQKQKQLSDYWAQQESIAKVPQYTVVGKSKKEQTDAQIQEEDEQGKSALHEAESLTKAAGAEVSTAEQMLSQWKALESAAESARSRSEDEKIGKASKKILSAEAVENGQFAGTIKEKEANAASENSQQQMQEISRFFERDARRYG